MNEEQFNPLNRNDLNPGACLVFSQFLKRNLNTGQRKAAFQHLYKYPKPLGASPNYQFPK